MNSLSSSINNYTEDDSQQYTSNDSGLSCNSNGGTESDHKDIPSQDFQCDDLTKSLFMNSFNGNGLIQDDDLYSYKSKMEFGNIFQNKFLSFNLTKSDHFNFKNSGSFSSIIHDVENLKLPETFYQPQITSSVLYKNGSTVNNSITDQCLRIVDEMKPEIRIDSNDKIKSKRNSKKSNTNEYLSSSIKNYRGDKALNDIVTFIQGSTKSSKSVTQSKTKSNKTPLIKVSECPQMKIDLVTTPDSGMLSDNSCQELKQTNNSNKDVDSGTQSSQFVSQNNSDEDSTHFFQEDFKQVLSKKQKKTCQKSNYQSEIQCYSKVESNLKLNLSKISTNKAKKSGKSKGKSSSYSVLHSKESFQQFLSDQYISFIKTFNTAS